MTTPNTSSDKTWELIENEKRRDRFIHRVNRMAWIATLVIVLLIVAMVTVQVIEMTKGALLGAVPWMTVMALAMPLIDVLWKLSLLIAALSTVGIFLRLRTASLTEIQLRLAALEQMLVSRPDSEQR
jgi:pheromone shutdown protein TraB